MKKPRSLAFSAFLMGIIILASKLMGLFRDVLIAGVYGTTELAVAYETASKLPITIFDFILGGVVTSAFIPIYSSISVKKSKKEAAEFASSYINLILIITLAITLAGELFAPALVKFIAPELIESTASLAVQLTRIMFPMVIFVGIAFSFVGFLQSEGEFNLPAVISLVSNLIMIAYLVFFSDRFGIIGLAVSMLIGWIAQALVQLPSAVKKGLRYSPRSSLLTPEIARAAKNTVPILVSGWTVPLCSLINTRIASGIEGGRAISALGYANKLYIIIVGLFSFVATNLLFPYFSRASASGDGKEADRLTRTSLKTLTFIIAPISVGVATLANPFISLIYEYGVFTPDDTKMTAAALTCYSVGMIFASLSEVITKSFFAREMLKFPLISSLASMFVNVILIIVLEKHLSVGGIAMITSVVSAVNFALNFIFAARKNVVKPRKSDIADLIKSVICALAMGAAILMFTSLTSLEGKILPLAIPVALGIVTYALAAAAIKSEEMTLLLSFISSKFGKKLGKSEK